MSESALTPTVDTPATPEVRTSEADLRAYRAPVVDPAPEPAGTVADPAEAEAAPASDPDPASEAGRELAKKRGSLQARIDQSVAKQREAERGRDEALRRAEEAERRLNERDRRNAERPQDVDRRTPGSHPTQTPPTYLTGPKPSPDQIGTLYDTYEDYTEALTDWKVDEKFARQHQASAEDAATRAEQAVIATYQARLDNARDTHADFDAVIQAAADLPVSLPMRDYFLESEVGPAMQYHLCQHPDECRRIAELPPRQALVALGKLETRLEAAPAGPSSVAPVVSNAPEPIKPVGGRSTGASTADPSQMNSIADWQKKRREYL